MYTILAAIAVVCLGAVAMRYYVVGQRESSVGTITADEETFAIDRFVNEAEVKGAYTINERQYASGGISIYYPEFEGLTNVKTQAKVNQKIKDSALEVLEYLKNNEKTTLEVAYTIKYASAGIASVAYSGYYNTEKTPYQQNVYYTHYIDLIKAKSMRLTDFYTVDKDFIDAVLYRTYTEGEQIAAVEYLKNQDIKSLVSQVKKADTAAADSGVYSFMGNGVFGISFPVPHALGDHVTFEVPLGELYKFQK